MKRLTRDHLHHTFSPSHPPALRVKQNETFIVETTDCFGGVVTPQHPSADPTYDTLNPVTGPIYVQGANVGDMLAATIHDIAPGGVGVARYGTSSGQLAHHVQCRSLSDCTRFFDLDEEKKIVTMRDAAGQNDENKRIAPISFNASPMLGVIGVAPAGGAKVSVPTMPAGQHGGNLDDRMNGIGSTIYIPVNQPGALLSVGDMHVSQGDGEICGTGVEIGGLVKLSCRILKKSVVAPISSSPLPMAKGNRSSSSSLFHTSSQSAPCLFPVTETATYWHTHGVTIENIPGATTVACEEAARLLVGQWGFTPEDAFVFLSAKGNLGLCQSCHPDKGTQIARMSVPKIDACPRPFRCLHTSVHDQS